MNNHKRLKKYSAALAIFLSALACNVSVADKSSITVNTYWDTFDQKCTESDCSLRDAIFEANNNSDSVEIILPGGLYNLNQDNFISNDDSGIYGDLDISGTIVIIGDGVDVTNINGMGRDRVFHVLPGGSLELRGMSIYNGNPDFSYPEVDCGFLGCGEIGPPPDFKHVVDEIGGGIIANRGYLKLFEVFVTQGNAEKGGGLLNLGASDIVKSNISGHTSDRGGGIYNSGTLTITNSYIGDYGLNTDPDNPGVDRGESVPNIAKWGGGIYNDPNGVIHLRELTYLRDNESTLDGGAIYNRGSIDMVRVNGTFNTAGRYGGFIYNIGELSMSRDFYIVGNDAFGGLTGNTAQRGGHIFNGTSGVVNIQDTDFQDAEAGTGAGIYNLGSLEVNRSFFSENNSPVNGSAIYNTSPGATASLTNVTISLNSGHEASGAIFVGGGNISLNNVTIALNKSRGILVTSSGNIRMRNTILDSNGNSNCSGPGSVISLGHNIDNGNSCALNTIGDMPNTSAELITNQFPSEYLSPSPKKDDIRQLEISPAIDNGDDENCPVSNQLKTVRPFGLGCDIGAIEVRESVDNSVPLEVDPDDNFQSTAIEPANELAPPPTATDAPPTLLPTDVPATAFVPTAVPPATNTPTTLPVSPTPNPPTPTLTPVPDPMNASISGTSWNDNNGNGSINSGEGGLPQTSVQLGAGSCNSSGLASTNTAVTGAYSFSGLAAGTYCVSATRSGSIASPTTSTNVTVVLSPGQTVTVDFGFQKIID